MNPVTWWRERRQRIADSEAKLRKQERLAAVVDHQRDEASRVSTWARNRLEENHLTQLFQQTIRERD